MNDAFQTDLGKTYFSNEVFDRIWSSMECIDSNNFDSETSYLLVWYDSLKHVYGDHLSSHNDRKLLVKTLNKTIKSVCLNSMAFLSTQSVFMTSDLTKCINGGWYFSSYFMGSNRNPGGQK